jgi:hypothetical protein
VQVVIGPVRKLGVQALQFREGFAFSLTRGDF